jgi:hypothetical protein
MELILNLDVGWPSGRLVHVRCVGMQLIPERDYGSDVTPLDGKDVASVGVFHQFLAEATRMAPDAGTVEVVGLQPAVAKILRLLKIEGPPPDPITVALDEP